MYRPPPAILRDPYLMLPHLERLVRESVAQRRAGLVPALHQTQVRYQREPPGSEDWLTALETWKAGWGDCEDLAIWRAADLRLQGYPAKVVIKLVRPGKMHAQVWDGKALRDPSRARGMLKGRHV